MKHMPKPDDTISLGFMKIIKYFIKYTVLVFNNIKIYIIRILKTYFRYKVVAMSLWHGAPEMSMPKMSVAIFFMKTKD